MMWNVNLECAEQLTFHIHDKSFKFEWIRLWAIKNFKSLYKVKGQLQILENS
jgi:hypothetical protein